MNSLAGSGERRAPGNRMEDSHRAYKYAAYDGLGNLEHRPDGRSGGAPALLVAASD